MSKTINDDLAKKAEPMMVSSTSMNAAMATTTAINQGSTSGRQASTEGDSSVGEPLSARSISVHRA
jgi:hypothetical protein